MSPLSQLESKALSFVASEISANKDAIVAEVQAEAPKAEALLADVNTKIANVFPAIVRPLISAELAKVEQQELTQLAGDAPALVDKVVALIQAEAARLVAA